MAWDRRLEDRRMMVRAIAVCGALTMLGVAAVANGTHAGFDSLTSMPTGQPSETLAPPEVVAAACRMACLQGNRDAGFATQFIDPANGRVFAAWDDAGGLFFRPDIAGWPERACAADEFWPEV
jgi:hypothetical protein